MMESYSNSEKQSLAAFEEKTTLKLRNRRIFHMTPYKLALVLHDIGMVFLIFILSAALGQPEFYTIYGYFQILLLYMISLIAIVYYPDQDLYNYHLIYSRKYHLIRHLKSVSLSLVTLGLVAGIYSGMALLTGKYFIPLLLILAASGVILNCFFGNESFYFLKPFGLSLLIIGVDGLVGHSNYSFVLMNWWTILLTCLLATVLLPISRFFLVHTVFGNWMRRRFRRQIVIIGSNEEANKIGQTIVKQNAPFWIVGVIGVTDAEIFLDIGIEKCFLGDLNKLPDVVEKDRISEIIVADENINKRTLVSLLDYCTSKGVNAWFSAKLMPIINVKLNIDNFCGTPLIRLCSQKNSLLFNKIKHTLDALIALPGFILQLPLFLGLAVAIKLDSKGPVLYQAEMVGKNGNLFKMYKYRTMHADCDQSFHKEYATNLIKGNLGEVGEISDKPLKPTNDPRVTRVGNALRKASLDELPQLINIIKGEMSLVGPRPCIPYEFELYKDWYKKRTAIRPGITGLWQVTGRSTVAFEDMILLDLYYIYNRSLALDLSILYETVFVVLGKKGAY